MAPSRKPKSVNKRFSHIEASPIKEGENANKSRQRVAPGTQKKKKLADMLGPQWSKQELERFYEAYRRYGKDWKKVAAAVHNRSLEMVEALYTMNRAYLSLPEGTASVVGLIAMMTDHYSVMGGSDSEPESYEDRDASVRPQKLVRGKSRNNTCKGLDGHHPAYSQSEDVAPSHGCLSLLKKRNSGIQPHAVRKRTPRVPVSYSFDSDKGEKSFSPVRQGFKRMADSNDDFTRKIALALTEASQRGSSPVTSQIPNRKRSNSIMSPGHSSKRKRAESENGSPKFRNGEMGENSSEVSLGSIEADNEDHMFAKKYRLTGEAAGTGNSLQKGHRYYQKKLEESADSHLDDIKEASSGTEGQTLGFLNANVDPKISDLRVAKSSPGCSKKRSKKVLFQKGEGSAFDALQTLADLSLMMPEADNDNESSVQAKEENYQIVDESKAKGNHASHGTKTISSKTSKLDEVVSDNVVSISDPKEIADPQPNVGKWRKKHKSSPFRVSQNEGRADSHRSGSQNMETTDELKKSVTKGKRSSLSGAHLKQAKVVIPSAHMLSSADNRGEGDDSALSPMQVSSANQVNQATRVKSKRKMDKPRPIFQRDLNLSGNTSSKPIPAVNDTAFNLKRKLSNCLASHLARRWCMFEWFYSAMDYPWFAKREFTEYLDHVGLGHVPRLTHIEWGVIRSSLGRPRRFSEQFLVEEKKKLNQYRESVRAHYAELLAGTREGLPADLARPLFVGQRVIAVHPKTRELHDGSILTIDHCKCRVQFDQPELGVEFVMDIDCMPMNPLENMPTSLKRNLVAVDKLFENSSEFKLSGKHREEKMEDHVKISPGNIPDDIYGLYASPASQIMNNQPKQGVSPISKLQAKVVYSEAVNVQEAASSQPSLAQFLPKEADVLALSALSRALERKEMVLSELKQVNDEVLECQKDQNNSLKDSEPFKRHYASVLLQLNEVNNEVSSALLCLRQRNTYQGSTPLLPSKSVAYSDGPGAYVVPFGNVECNGQEPVSHVAKIVESSRLKAQMMVHTAIRAMSSYRKEQNKVERLEDAIDFVNNQLSVNESATPVTVSVAEESHGVLASRNQLADPSNTHDHEPNISLDQNEVKIPSELIGHCLATLLMIQKCTERQFPPADVAQALDSAVSSLQPFCSKNLPIYSEIQKCMGIIRNQILALIPT